MTAKIFDDGLEEFVRRSDERARNPLFERIKLEKTITFADAEDLAACLTPQRVRLFQATRRCALSISALALELNRNRGSVTRDVNMLRKHGLIELRERVNAGHGRMQVVCPVARKVDMRVAL